MMEMECVGEVGGRQYPLILCCVPLQQYLSDESMLFRFNNLNFLLKHVKADDKIKNEHQCFRDPDVKKFDASHHPQPP